MSEDRKTLKEAIAELVEELELVRGAITRLAEIEEELIELLKRHDRHE